MNTACARYNECSAALRIVAVCSLCGHQYTHLFDATEQDEHMAEAHGMYFDPKPLGGDRRDERSQPGT